MPGSHVALERFSAPTRTWFAAAFAEPTPAQDGAWEAISQGRHALVVAPTGSGKTLSAFLWAIDRLLTEGRPPEAGTGRYDSPPYSCTRVRAFHGPGSRERRLESAPRCTIVTRPPSAGSRSCHHTSWPIPRG